MNDNDCSILIEIKYNDQIYTIESKEIKTMKEIKEELIKKLNLKNIDENFMKFTLEKDENTIISSENDIITNSYISAPDKLILKLNLSIIDNKINKNNIEPNIELNDKLLKKDNNPNELKIEVKKKNPNKTRKKIINLENEVKEIDEKNILFETKISENNTLIEKLFKNQEDFIEKINQINNRIESLKKENEELKEKIFKHNDIIGNLFKELQKYKKDNIENNNDELNIEKNDNNVNKNKAPNKINIIPKLNVNHIQNNNYDNKCKTERIDNNKINEFRKNFGDDTKIFSDKKIKEKIEDNNGDNHLAIIDLMLDNNLITDSNQ